MGCGKSTSMAGVKKQQLLEHVARSMRSAPVRDLEVEYFLYD